MLHHLSHKACRFVKIVLNKATFVCSDREVVVVLNKLMPGSRTPDKYSLSSFMQSNVPSLRPTTGPRLRSNTFLVTSLLLHHHSRPLTRFSKSPILLKRCFSTVFSLFWDVINDKKKICLDAVSNSNRNIADSTMASICRIRPTAWHSTAGFSF